MLNISFCMSYVLRNVKNMNPDTKTGLILVLAFSCCNIMIIAIVFLTVQIDPLVHIIDSRDLSTEYEKRIQQRELYHNQKHPNLLYIFSCNHNYTSFKKNNKKYNNYIYKKPIAAMNLINTTNTINSINTSNSSSPEAGEAYQIHDIYNQIEINCTDSHATSKRWNKSQFRTVVATIAFYGSMRNYSLVLENHRQYALDNGYDYFVLREPIESDISKENGNILGTQQRALLIENLMYNSSFIINHITNYTYDRVLCIDMDVIFLNNSITIDSILMNNIENNGNYRENNKIKNTNNSSKSHVKSGLNLMTVDINIDDDSVSTSGIEDISLILAGDWKWRINAGVLIFIKSDFTKQLLQLWRSIMVLTNINDQDSLALLLFHYPNVTRIFEKSKKQLQDTYTGANIANVNTLDNINNYINNSQQNVSHQQQHHRFVNMSQFGLLKQYCESINDKEFIINYYGGLTVTRQHIEYVYNDLLSDNLIVKKHVLWVETIKMNSNIWYQVYNNQIMNQWIIHFAGQGDFKQMLIEKFVSYKKEYKMIIQDRNKQGNVKLRQLILLHDRLEKFVLQYIKRISSHWPKGMQKKHMIQCVMDTHTRLDKIMSVWKKIHLHPPKTPLYNVSFDIA